jgi:hypothetical protein
MRLVGRSLVNNPGYWRALLGRLRLMRFFAHPAKAVKSS